jgi:hypothetical protein
MKKKRNRLRLDLKGHKSAQFDPQSPKTLIELIIHYLIGQPKPPKIESLENFPHNSIQTFKMEDLLNYPLTDDHK